MQNELDSNDMENLISGEITETEKEQVIKSKIGQSAFKKTLLAINKTYRLCGVTNEHSLVASHIKPWSKSNNQERLDVNNGLLLCPNHDSFLGFYQYLKSRCPPHSSKNLTPLAR